jgi:hypothetical protein
MLPLPVRRQPRIDHADGAVDLGGSHCEVGGDALNQTVDTLDAHGASRERPCRRRWRTER